MIKTVKRNYELWELAIWVDRELGEDAEQFIAERVLHCEAEGDNGGKQLWMNVARRYVELRSAEDGDIN